MVVDKAAQEGNRDRRVPAIFDLVAHDVAAVSTMVAVHPTGRQDLPGGKRQDFRARRRPR